MGALCGPSLDHHFLEFIAAEPTLALITLRPADHPGHLFVTAAELAVKIFRRTPKIEGDKVVVQRVILSLIW
jgi:hypothetical protein